MWQIWLCPLLDTALGELVRAMLEKLFWWYMWVQENLLADQLSNHSGPDARLYMVRHYIYPTYEFLKHGKHYRLSKAVGFP